MATNQDQFQKEQMKRTYDPRTETVSYSGADWKAVIYLPLTDEYVKEKIAEIETKIDRLEAGINRYQFSDPILSGHYIDLQEGYIAELTEYQKTLNHTAKYRRPEVLADVQTVTVSSHREKFPVRVLGRVHPKSFTRGPRTVAGSLIFTVFHKAPLFNLLELNSKFYSTGVLGSEGAYPVLSTVLVDQLPPFDITLVASNEVGDSSYMVLYGVEIVNEGQTMSIQDMITENVMQFYARDFDPLRPMTTPRQLLKFGDAAIGADNIVNERLNAIQRRGIRLNPFV